MTKDIAIIGGSAAGFFTAYLLARKGCKVKVYEVKEDIQLSSRTLIVTNYMRELIGSLSESLVVNKINRFELFAEGRVAKIMLCSPDLVIDRSKLILRLATQAEANGAQVLNGYRFHRLKPNGKRLGFTVSCNGDGGLIEKSANIIVGADGACSKVARSAGWPKQMTVPVFQTLVKLPKDMPSDTTRVWFVPEDTPFFYWLIPHSPTHGVLGLISEEGQEIQGSLEGFLEKRGLEPIEFQNAQVTLYTRWIPNHRKIGESHVYLVGDAAGHVKVSTMGGVVTGFRGALGVAEAVLNGGYSREFRLLRRELDRHKLIRRVLHDFTQADYARLLDLLSSSVKRSLGLFNRDKTSNLLLHVFFKRPHLLLFGLRALLLGK